MSMKTRGPFLRCAMTSSAIDCATRISGEPVEVRTISDSDIHFCRALEGNRLTLEFLGQIACRRRAAVGYPDHFGTGAGQVADCQLAHLAGSDDQNGSVVAALRRFCAPGRRQPN